MYLDEKLDISASQPQVHELTVRRPRDVPPEDRYGGGQSYRPGNVRNRTPPRRDNEFYDRNARRDFDGRGPPPRNRTRSPVGRQPFRRRSPSPRDRFGVPRGGDSYRARSRTPPRRDDDGFRRGPDKRDDRDGRRFGDDRDFRDNRGPLGRSPPRRDRSPGRFGDRSPMNGRTRRSPPRRFSPAARRFDDGPPSRPRSPPRRGFSPRDSDRGPASRPRSPIMRNDNANDREGWRRQGSPSSADPRQDRDHDKGRDSTATSRRSSPPLHASRLALIDRDGQRSGRPSPRSNHGEQARSSAQAPPPRLASPVRDRDGDVTMQDNAARPPVDHDRDAQLQPPNGPRESRPPPLGPRLQSSSTIAPPAGPRGDSGPARGGFASRGRGAYTVDFTGRGRGAAPQYAPDRAVQPPLARGGSYERDAVVPPGPRPYAQQPPSRPGVSRQPSMQSGRFDNAADHPRDSWREPQSNLYRRQTEPGMIPSGPAGDRTRDIRRSDSGIHPALRDLPEIVTNGRKMPLSVDQSRLSKLEDDSERLRKIMQEKDAKRRKCLREWDRLVRETEVAAFRSEVAEESLRAYELEAEGTRLAF